MSFGGVTRGYIYVLPAAYDAKAAMSINATELVWDFFEAHPKS